jgi:hypothetical protein
LARQRIALIALVALLGPQASGTAQAPDESARDAATTLSLAPSEGDSGSTVRASGTGYCGSVALRWDDDLPLTSGYSDERGNILITFTVPGHAALGPHTVTSISDCGGTTVSFEVVNLTSTPTSPPQTTVPPPQTTGPPAPADTGHALPGAPPPTATVAPAPAETGEAPPGASAPSLTVPPVPAETGAAPPAHSPTSGGVADSNIGSTLAQYEEIVKREVQSGVILYNPPDHMRVGDVNRIEVRISRQFSDELAKGLQGTADPKIAELLVGTTMRAKLEGKEFDIVPIGSDVQELPTTGYREWRWDVTPTTAGHYSLIFTVSVFLYEKYSNPIEEKVLDSKIDVTSNPVYSLRAWFSNNWGKFIAAVVSVVGVAIELYRRRKGADEEPDDSVPEPSEELKNVP